MHEVVPKVFRIAETGLTRFEEFLDSIGATDWDLEGHISDGEGLIELAGRTCYKSFGTELNKNLTRVRNDHHEYVGNILKTKHGSVLEHATVTYALVDVSRILTHELVRHRAGCAYSQESMRFVRLEDVGMFIPSCIKEDPTALTLFTAQVKSAEETYQRLVDQLIAPYSDMPFSKKKEITSAIRRIAPSGHSTNIVLTANHRALRHLIELRTASGVEEEIGVTFEKVALDLRDGFPALYQDMVVTETKGQAWKTISFANSKI